MPAFWRARWVQAFEGAGPAECLRWSSCRVFRWFCPLSRFVFGALYLNMPLFRVLRAFLAGFGCFVWVYVACVLCVACGALYACGVRRIKGLWRVCLSFCPFAFLLLPFFSSLYLLFVLHLVCFVLVVFCLSSCLVCPCVFVVFIVSFSLSVTPHPWQNLK